jgi:stearoyl-CoA desaturase (delta-9 desaturase)
MKVANLQATSPVGVCFGGVAALRKRIENTLLIGVPLAGSLITPYWLLHHTLAWIELSAFLASYIAVGLGISLGFHRYFSHRSFTPKPWIAWLLAAAGTMAFQGSVLRWVADHRRHHAHTDNCGDLHSPYIDAHCSNASTFRGFVHAHIGWMFDDSVTDHAVFARDLLDDPLVSFFHRTQWFWPVVSLATPWLYGFAFGGVEHAWSSFLLAGCARTTILHNVVWSVNSFGHFWGYESFPQENKSRNNAVLALLTFGDGWHNNHHRFPRSAFHGLSATEIDLNGKIITMLERCGFAHDVIRVPSERLGSILVKSSASAR